VALRLELDGPKVAMGAEVIFLEAALFHSFSFS
jgi:hypothetical protein